MTFSCNGYKNTFNVQAFVRETKDFRPCSRSSLSEPHQTLDELLQLLLGLLHCFFSANHSDELLVLILRGGEDDPGAGAVADLADVSSTFPNEEFMVFWLCTQLGSVALCLLVGGYKIIDNMRRR